MKSKAPKAARLVWRSLFASLALAVNFSHLVASAEEASVAFKTDDDDKITNATLSIKDQLAADPAKFNSKKEFITKSETFTVNVPAVEAKVTPIVNGKTLTDLELPSGGGALPITLEKEGTNSITLKVEPDGAENGTITSNPLFVELDRTGPMLQRAEAIVSPISGTTVLVTFADDDLNKADATNAVTIHRQNKDGNFLDNVSFQTPTLDGRQLRIPVLSLPSGQYKLTLTKDGDNAILTDAVGNPAQGVLTTTFSVLPGRAFGEQVQFPRFAPPTKQEIPDEGFNPGDFVETARRTALLLPRCTPCRSDHQPQYPLVQSGCRDASGTASRRFA